MSGMRSCVFMTFKCGKHVHTCLVLFVPASDHAPWRARIILHSQHRLAGRARHLACVRPSQPRDFCADTHRQWIYRSHGACVSRSCIVHRNENPHSPTQHAHECRGEAGTPPPMPRFKVASSLRPSLTHAGSTICMIRRVVQHRLSLQPLLQQQLPYTTLQALTMTSTRCRFIFVSRLPSFRTHHFLHMR